MSISTSSRTRSIQLSTLSAIRASSLSLSLLKDDNSGQSFLTLPSVLVPESQLFIFWAFHLLVMSTHYIPPCRMNFSTHFLLIPLFRLLVDILQVLTDSANRFHQSGMRFLHRWVAVTFRDAAIKRVTCRTDAPARVPRKASARHGRSYLFIDITPFIPDDVSNGRRRIGFPRTTDSFFCERGNGS